MSAEESIGLVSISAIVPTIGRAESLERLLRSLSEQTIQPTEVVIADGSDGTAIREIASSPQWQRLGLNILWLAVTPPNAVRQRRAAVNASAGDFLLFLDDDVELEKSCIAELLKPLRGDSHVVATMADFSNQSWSEPTRLWRIYLRFALGMKGGEWQGRVLGPLLRFGFHPVPKDRVAIEWFGAGNSVIRRSAYENAGGFSDFFLRRATINEDVDLGLKVSKLGRILFCPGARMAHHHAPFGRMSNYEMAEDDVFNRYRIMKITQGIDRIAALRKIFLYVFIESMSTVYSAIKGRDIGGGIHRILGRSAALCRVIVQG
jgi:GT2 family glycosyltransferase